MPRITIVPTGGSLGPRSRASVDRLPLDVEVAGAGEARGDLLLFLESGDVLVASGVLALLASLDTSGADAAVGSASTSGTPAALLTAVAATSVDATPELLEHPTVAAVLWRRSWWEQQSLRWPDRPEQRRGVLARALAAADAVDVVPEPVVEAQARSPRLRKAELHLRAEDMAAVARGLDDLHDVAGSLPPATRAHWYQNVLEPAISEALPGLPEAETGVQDRLIARIGAVVRDAGPALTEGLPAVTRLQYHLAGRGLGQELVQVVTADRSGELRLRHWVLDGDEHLGELPFRQDADLAVPREVYRLDREMDLRARVEHVRWEGDLLHVDGIAHLRLVDLDSADGDRLDLALVRAGDGRRLELPVERVHRPDVTVRAREAAYCYDWAGFRTVVDIRRLRDDGGWRAGVWRLEASAESQGVRRARTVAATEAGGARHPELREMDQVRIVPVTGRGTFGVEVDMLPAVLTATEVTAGSIRLTGRLRRRTRRRSSTAELRRLSGAAALDVPVRFRPLGRTFTADLPLGDLLAGAAHELDGEITWSLRLVLPGVQRTVALRMPADLPAIRVTHDGREVTLTATPHGRAVVSVRRPRPVVDSARWLGDELELSGRWPAGLQASLLLVSRRAARDRDLTPVVTGDRFSVRWRPAAMPTLAGDLPLPHGHWLPAVRVGDDPDEDVPLAADSHVLAALPLEHTIGTKSFTLTEDDDELDLDVGPDLVETERGPANQHRLRMEEFPALLRLGLCDEVLFESYESRAYGDNARAIYEELSRRAPDLRCLWVVADGQTALPEGIHPVRRNSRDHFEALARARHVVVPNYRPMESWFQTPPGQVVVQTWHGAPFKRIALDNPRWDALTTREHTELIKRESARWDYLISPNPPSTPILRGAFGYEGEMLETGYPRTDQFFAPDRDRVAAEVRRRLEIDPSARVVLYAPTMRDDHRYAGNRYSLEMRLDLAAARRALGDDHVLLVRSHAKVVDSVPGVDGQFARDVSSWPDVNELLLATDVLVTDYSSLMFDFANTGRPMLFFTYDLADYRDRLRGFYFDPQRVPGPHLSTSDEVVAAIRDVESLHAQHANAYREFTAEFNAWDDGHASARLVERVFADYL